MGCGSSKAVPVDDPGAEALVSKTDGKSGAGGVGLDGSASISKSSSSKKPSLVERLMGKDGDTIVGAALKSKRNRGAVILGDPSQVQVGKQAYVKRSVPKSPEIRSMLLNAIRANVLFSALGHNEVEDIVDALEPRGVSAGTTVITQGETGDNFYVIETGRFDIIVNSKKVADWGEGKNRTFGELALLYNSPRAASVRAVTDARLWQIDRLTFRNVVAQASFAQHEKLKAALKKGILEDLSEDQLHRIADAATVVRYAAGDHIIRKGEEGEVFFIIESGAVICKNLSGDQSNNILHAGDYFGERALLKKEPRAADVFAETDCTLIALHREDFENLLGHLRELLEHNLGMRLLLCVPMLASLSDADRAVLFSSLRIASYADGHVILPEAAVPANFFIVKEGTVAVVRHSRPESGGSNGGPAASQSATPSSSRVHSARAASAAAGSAAVLPALGAGASSPSARHHQGNSPSSGGRASEPASAHVSSMLLPGHWFPHSEIAAQTPLAVSYVAKGPVQVFVTDRATYTAVLAPLTALRSSGRSRGAAAAAVPALPAVRQEAGGAVSNTHSQGGHGPGAGGVGTLAPSSNGPQQAAAGSFSSLGAGSKLLDPDSAAGIAARRLSSGVNVAGRYSAAASESHSPRKRLGIPFRELEQRATLGTGTFGRVKLVYHRKSNRVFALKMLQKSQIVALKQQTNIMNEREILWRVDHPFVIKLFDTYKDQNRLYMLLELVQGGELFSRLQNSPSPGRVSPAEARFYGACVLDAFDYVHSHSILYRDLKPENLLIDADGYLKLVDFGFAKVVADKTYTLCGTPEYLAPELVLGRGHDKGVDYWALGILLYEQVTGYSPFADHANNDQMVICRNILKGEFEFPAHVKDKDMRDIIQRLLVKDITRRIGCLRGGATDVKAHRFFRAVDFEALTRKEVPPPWRPKLSNPLDTSNFDEYDEDDRVETYVEKDGIGWDKDF